MLHRTKWNQRSWRARAPFALALAVLSGCEAYTLRGADLEGQRIQREKQAEVEAFRAAQIRRPEDVKTLRTPEKPPVNVPAVLTLDDAVRIATEFSRDYQTQREAIFLAALSLGLTRRDFLEPVFNGSLAYLFSGTRNGPSSNGTAATLGVSQLLPTGARVDVSTTSSIATSDVSGPNQNSSFTGTANFTQPLLRGAGYQNAYESLTQSEHDLLYSVREFERYREQFAIDVISNYYDLVSQKQQVENTRRSLEGQKFVADRADAFYKVDRLNKIEKLRADQAYLTARNRLLDAEQGYKLSLDRFKILLGLPTDTEFEIPVDAQPPLLPVDVDLDAAVQTALHNRLDLLTEHDRVDDAERQLSVAKNRMLPDLSLTGSYLIASDPAVSFGSLAFRNDTYTLGVNLELPLDRKAERNAYRTAAISLDRARRDLRKAEDETILAVRDTLRRLKQQRESIEIQKQIIDTETNRVRIAEIQYQAGEIGTRDVTEARESLLDAQNSLVQATVSHEVARLDLLRQLGILYVDAEGKIVK